jgi:hypothetical protein
VADTVLHHTTPLVTTLDRLGTLLPDQAPAPTKGLDPDRLADVADATGTIRSIREARSHPLIQRIMGRAIPGALVGGLGLGSKAGLMQHQAGGGVKEMQSRALHGMELGAGIGALTGTGVELFDTATQGRRLRRAQGVLSAAPQYIKDRLKNPDVEAQANAYEQSRDTPARFGELGLLAGGIAGSAAGIGSAHPVEGESTVMVPGLQVPLRASQLHSAGRWGLVGGLGLGAVGLLAGVLYRHHQRQKLVDQLGTKTAADKTQAVNNLAHKVAAELALVGLNPYSDLE